MTVGLSLAALTAKLQAGEITEVLRIAGRVIALANGDPAKGNVIIGSPLAVGHTFRGNARWCLGLPGWKDDFRQAIDMARAADGTTQALVIFYIYATTVPWVLPADATALVDTAEALAVAERSGDDMALDLARCVRGIVLVHQDRPDLATGLGLLNEVREHVLRDRFSHAVLSLIDAETARAKMRHGDVDGAIALLRTTTDELLASGESLWPLITAVLVEALLLRGASGDVDAAQAALERSEAVPRDPDAVGMTLHHVQMRALIARARGDDKGYRENADRYHALATSLGSHGHIAAAEAMS